MNTQFNNFWDGQFSVLSRELFSLDIFIPVFEHGSMISFVPLARGHQVMSPSKSVPRLCLFLIKYVTYSGRF